MSKGQCGGGKLVYEVREEGVDWVSEDDEVLVCA